MSTRKRSKNQRASTNGDPTPTEAVAPGALSSDPGKINEEHLPPTRPRKKALQPVSKPLHNTSFKRVIYYLSGAALLFLGFYAWRLTVWKSQAGGWWNLALGRRPPVADTNGQAGTAPQDHTWKGTGGRTTSRNGDKNDVANRVSDLAQALGIQPTVLASALVDVLQTNVPPATMSSISASASAALETKGSGDEKVLVLDALLGNAITADDPSTAEQVVGGVRGAFDTVVGMEEPTELD